MEKYILPELPYGYDALEPYIDAKTLKVHHNGHHRSYVEKLNSVMGNHPHLIKRVEELLASLDDLPIDIRTEVKNNAGGHANHSLFWTLLTPSSDQEPKGSFAKALKGHFNNFSNFRDKFSKVANGHFASGWAWLCTDTDGKLSIFSTKDHESPITMGLSPLLVLDLWEHAYYISYQNRRSEFVDSFWNIVNWKEVGARWEDVQKKGASNREWRYAS